MNKINNFIKKDFIYILLIIAIFSNMFFLNLILYGVLYAIMMMTMKDKKLNDIQQWSFTMFLFFIMPLSFIN